jgi:hypothetical protein
MAEAQHLILARRRFLFGAGAIAAPAIIGVDRVMKFFTPPVEIIPPRAVTTAQFKLIERLTEVRPYLGGGLDIDVDKFRAVVEPVLRRHFEEAYRKVGIEDQLAAYHQRLYDRGGLP